MKGESYIKFKCNWIKAELNIDIGEPNKWRNKLYNLDLIGADSEGYGFGNISQRLKNQKFLITGSNTGSLPRLTQDHYTLVQNYNIDKNTVTCKGPIMASSESMSHAVIYENLSDINAVMHVHHHDVWKKLLGKIPTTSKKAEYGTPELAHEIERLIKEDVLRKEKIFVCGGETDGIFSFGKDLQEAGETLSKYIKFKDLRPSN